MPFRLKNGGGDAKSEITGGLTFDGTVEDEIITGVGYEAAKAYWTDFVIQGWSTGGEALNDVVAVKIAATEAIPAGTKIVLNNSTTAEYTLTQGLQNGDVIIWADAAITPIIAEVQWSISVDKANGDDWYAPPIAFTFMREV